MYLYCFLPCDTDIAGVQAVYLDNSCHLYSNRQTPILVTPKLNTRMSFDHEESDALRIFLVDAATNFFAKCPGIFCSSLLWRGEEAFEHKFITKV